LLMLFAGIYTMLLLTLIHNFRQSKKTHDLIENLEVIVSNTAELSRVAKMMKNIGSLDGLDSIEDLNKGKISIKKPLSPDPSDSSDSSNPLKIEPEPGTSPVGGEEEEEEKREKEETPASEDPPLAKLLKQRKEK
jgi:hypothetical protein